MCDGDVAEDAVGSLVSTRVMLHSENWGAGALKVADSCDDEVEESVAVECVGVLVLVGKVWADRSV